MKLNFKFNLIYLYIAVIIYFLYSILFVFLNKAPLYKVLIDKKESFYFINLTDKFFSNNKPRKIKKRKINKTVYNINNLKLKAIYKAGENSFVLLEDKSKSIFLDLNDTYKGYKLIKVYSTKIELENDSKKYILYLIKPSNNLNYQNKNEVINKKVNVNKTYNSFNSNERIKTIPKKVLRYYINNLRFIWNTINLVKDNEGYRITYIKPGSVLYRIGFRKDDIILEVNGIKLNSDSKAWYVFNNIAHYKYIVVKIIRNNEVKVLDYEIK